MVESHALVGYAIQIGGRVDAGTMTADGLGRMVISHDEHNVGSLRHGGGFSSTHAVKE